MARMKIQRSPRIRVLCRVACRGVNRDEQERRIEDVLDVIDQDLLEAFKLGQKFPLTEEKT